MPIPLPTNGHSNEGDSTDPVNTDNDIENNAIHGFSSDKPFNTQIPGLSLEIILTESSRVTA
nr:624_t:CDS:2 [Entrophospora candida]